MYPELNESDPKKRIDLRIEGTYLAMLIGGIPGDAVDLEKVVKEGETTTRLKVDLENRNIVYENEEYVSGETDVPDTVSLTQVGQALALDDIGNVAAETPNEGDLLVFMAEEWRSVTPAIDDLVSVLGLNADGEVVKTDSSGIGGGGGVVGLPIGSGMIWPGAEGSIPSGYVPLDGRALNRTVYSELFALIGTTYGVGDNSTTFNIPNTKGRVITGLDTGQTEFNTLGKTVGAKTHVHGLSDGYARVWISGNDNIYIRQKNTANWSSNQAANGTSISNGTGTSSAELGGSTDSSANLQPGVTMQYIMRII